MPRALDPNQTTEIVLSSDKGDENPARFIYRALNCREWIDKRKRWEEAEKKDTMLDVAAIGLVDWKIDGIEFDADKLGDVVTPYELTEMILIHLNGERLAAEDKKKLESRHESNGESFATSAQPSGV
jgi:hypothetical protein